MPAPTNVTHSRPQDIYYQDNKFYTSVFFTPPGRTIFLDWTKNANHSGFIHANDGTNFMFNIGPLDLGSTYNLALWLPTPNNLPDAENSVKWTITTPSVPPFPPNAATNVLAVAGNGSATVSWNEPSFGSPISYYTVKSSTGLSINTTTRSLVVTGLANGTPLSFTVIAFNNFGQSPESASSSAVTPATIPVAPHNISAIAGNASAVVSWSAPSNGGSAITNYIITPSVGSPVTVGNVLTATIMGLTNGTAVSFRVAARNSVGDSVASSASNTVTPNVVPNAPTGVSAIRGDASAVVSWSAPPSNGGTAITGYIITPSAGAAITVGNVLTATLTGLTNGTPVTFTVIAVNSLGNSSSSSTSSAVTPGTPPGTPMTVSATAGNASAVVSWSAPSSNGGLAITAYIVTSSLGVVVNVGNVLTTNITDLTNGTPVTFTVVARNSIGDSSSSSPSLAVIPNIVPGAPTGVSATAGNASAVVTWSTGSNNGTPVTNYIVTPSVGAAITVGNVLTATLTGLTNGTPITFTVMAANDAGNSSPSAASSSVTPATNPETPTAVSAIRGNASAVVSWTAPSNGGSAITNYIITPSSGSPVTVGNVSTVTITGLENGAPVTFTVLARNSIGDSSSSSPSAAVTPATVPNAPTAVSATSGNASVVVSWAAPSNGGSAITGYTITPSVGSPVTVGNVLTATITGLTNGSSVTFTVVARNSVGDSSSSSPSTEVIPATVPNAPTGVSAISGSGSAVVTWSAPAVDGGSDVTGYIVTPSVGAAVTVGDVLTATVSGLTDGVPVTFTVMAMNNLGNSSASAASSSVTPLSVSSVPRGVSAVAGVNSATVSWFAPISNGGSEITGYTITPSTGAAVTVENVLTTTLTGLASGVPLTFTIVAINSVGTSFASLTSNTIIPNAPVAGPPTSVLGLTGVVGVASATISWTPPVSDGGAVITGYKVICVPDNKKPNLAGPNDRSLVVTNLKNTVPASFRVVALNATGQSDSVSLTAYPLPSVPKVTAVRGASGVINLTWTAAPSNVASPITGYVVSLVSGAQVEMVIPTPTVTVTGGVCSVSGLTNGSAYVFSVKSVSNIGQSLGGLSKPVIAARAPDVPTGFAGVRAVKSVSLSWTAPANTGGLPITGYTISYIMNGVAKLVNVKLVNSAIIKGLVDGTAYTFRIKATNLVGQSAEADPVTLTPGAGN